jgi:uncharacterized protein (DUF342 family)
MNSENINSPKPPAVDSFAAVKLGEKNFSASIEVFAPRGGGSDVTIDILKAALKDAGVCYGIDENVLTQIAERRIYRTTRTVAQYSPPKNGIDGTITYKFDKIINNIPIENEEGYVDYRELGNIKSITKGTVIADITLPIDGVPGRDVLGREIAPVPPKKAAFTVGVGTVLSADGLTLYAAVDGHLVYDKNAFSVRKVLDVKADIDFNTGNIEFISDINIRGNVGEGFKVVSTGGNVTIQGAIFSGAVIKAFGNITLNMVANHAKIEAGGNISAAFCEYCNLKAGGDITVQTMILSTAYCGGTLNCTGKGGLVGGHYTVLSGAIINGNIGSPHYPQTEILLGNNTVLADERDRLLAEIESIEKQIIDLGNIVDFLNAKKRKDFTLTEEKEHLLGESVRTRIMKNRAVGGAKKRIEEIEQLLDNIQDLRMTVGGTVYSKTRLCINTAKYVVRDDLKNVTIFVDKNNNFHFDNM